MVVVDPKPIPAVTIRQPWAWAMRTAQCPLINMDWRPPPYIAYQYIGLHVGKSWKKRERLAASSLAGRLYPDHQVPLAPDGYLFAHLFGFGRLVGFIDLEFGEERGPFTHAYDTSRGRAWVGGNFDLATVERALQSRFWQGPCGWIFRHVRPLTTPIELNGRPKVWYLPGAVALNAVAQIGN